jgi:argininosuccinate lyase
VAFRDAHEQVGRVVRAAIEQGVELDVLSLETIREHAPAAEAEVSRWLTLDGAIERRCALGGTSMEQVQLALAAAKELVLPNIRGSKTRGEVL